MGDAAASDQSGPIDRRSFVQSTAAALAAVIAGPSLLAAEAQVADLTRLSLAAASDLVHAGKVSPVELTKACLDRIARFEPKLNAFITVTEEYALEQARTAEREIRAGNWRGRLHGIPIGLKDNIDTEGIRTTAASAVFADRVPTEDAEVVRRLRAAGAITVGKLNMHEFANGGSSVVSFWGAVHNPWSLDHETGGSSGGSAAAVAADCCFGALGTDTGGSIRVPASHCSVVGFKPTYGRVSNRGVIPLCWSYDHVGPLGKTVEDVAIMLQAIAGYDERDVSTIDTPVPDYASALKASPRTLRVGIPHALFYDILEPEVRDGVHAALATIRSLVGSVQDVVLPSVLDLGDCGDAEFLAFHEPLFERAGGLYQLQTARNLKAAMATKATNYVRGRRVLEERRREVARVFRQVDVLIAPTVKYAPRTIKYYREHDAADKPFPPEIWNTWLFNIFGLPAMSVPCGFTAAGLPIGVMIAGPPFGERNVLTLGHAFERATEWHLRKPPIAAD